MQFLLMEQAQLVFIIICVFFLLIKKIIMNVIITTLVHIIIRITFLVLHLESLPLFEAGVDRRWV